MASLGAPVKVSPLIKTGRWVGLVAGLLYGSAHYRTLSKKQAIIREEEAKLAVIRNAELAAEKARANEAEMKSLGEQIGIKAAH